MADLAPTTVEPSGAPAPAAEPSPGAAAAPAAPQEPAKGTPEQAQGQPSPAAAPSEGPEPVPYPRFRSVQTENTRLRRQLEQMGGDVGKTREQVAQMEQDLARLRTVEQQHQAIRAALAQHRDIAEALQERLGRAPTARETQAAGGLPPELLKRLEVVDRLEKRFQSMDEMAAQNRQQQADLQLSQALDKSIRGQFEKHEDYKEVADVFAPVARAYIMGRISQDDMVDATVEDVPYLFNEWFRTINGAVNKIVDRRMNAARGTAGLPPAPAAPGAPVRPRVEGDAFGEKTVRTLEERLRGIGWNDTGAGAAG